VNGAGQGDSFGRRSNEVIANRKDFREMKEVGHVLCEGALPCRRGKRHVESGEGQTNRE